MNDTNLNQSEEYLQRADKALQAAQLLLEKNLIEDCISRSYYAVLHAVKAALATVSIFVDSHHGARKMFALHFIKTSKIEKEWYELFITLLQERAIVDYEIDLGVEKDLATTRVNDARRFIQRIKRFLQK